MSMSVFADHVYDVETLIEEILADIAKGVTLADICRRDHMPDRTRVYDWLKRDEKMAQRFARAREDGFDVIAESCLEIADNSKQDFKDDDSSLYNAEHVQRSKLRIETRLKLLAKWDPKRYGDKQQIEHTGHIASDTPDEELDRRLLAHGIDPAMLKGGK